jgi:hypothetical protein
MVSARPRLATVDLPDCYANLKCICAGRYESGHDNLTAPCGHD